MEELKPEEIDLPAFWSALRKSDVQILALQNKGRAFSESHVLAVGRRCAFGKPQVVVSSPLSHSMKPFPTLLWLTCPFLNRRCGELESQQKIAELEKIFAVMADEIARYHTDYAALRLSLVPIKTQRELSRTNPSIFAVLAESGVGGINYSGGCPAPKCLHLQTASWLGMGHHPAASWLAAEIGPLNCSSGSCVAFV